MKRTAITLAILLALGVTASGCNAKAKKQQAAKPNGTEQSSSQKQNQFSRPDLSGEITAIEGNEITLKEIDASPSRENRGPGPNDGNRPSRPDPNQAPGSKEAPSQPPQGQRGDRAPQGQPGPQGDPNGPRGQRPVKYTGETKKITIPDGVSVTEMARGQNGPEQKTVEAKDLKAGDVLQVWYSDKEKGVISKISVRRSSENSKPAPSNEKQ